MSYTHEECKVLIYQNPQRRQGKLHVALSIVRASCLARLIPLQTFAHMHSNSRGRDILCFLRARDQLKIEASIARHALCNRKLSIVLVNDYASTSSHVVASAFSPLLISLS